MYINHNADFFLHHLVTDTADYERVKSHWHKHFTQVCPAEHAARTLMHLVIEQIRQNDYQVQHDYTFHVEEIRLHYDPTDASAQAKAAVRLLMDIVFYYEELENETYIPRRLLDTVSKGYTYVRGSEVNIKFNAAIHNYLRNVARLDNLGLIPELGTPHTLGRSD